MKEQNRLALVTLSTPISCPNCDPIAQEVLKTIQHNLGSDITMNKLDFVVEGDATIVYPKFTVRHSNAE